MAETSPVPVRHHRLRLPQGSLFWHEAGRGDAILFLHGTWQDSSQWYELLQHLSSKFHCIAPDLLGFGESSVAQSPYSIALETESLETLLTRLRLQRVYLVGHSLGAWVALALAQRYPERVKGVLAIAPEGFEPQALSRRWALDRWLVAPWSPLAWCFWAMSPLLQRFKAQGWLLRLRQRRQRLHHAPAAARLLFRRRRSEILAELASSQLAPLLVPLVVLESVEADAVAHQLTHACLQTFPQAYHQLVPAADNALGLDPEVVANALVELTATAQKSPPASRASSSYDPQPVVSG
jgi:pimeloyl-ACP methyl ester carboxylesterase